MAAYIRENKDSLTIDSVCYTLQMGRKHHAYRAAFLVGDLEELCQKLKQAERRGIVSDQEKVFLGRYSIVPENKTKREAYEITAEESAQRTRQAAAAMESLAAGERRGWPSLLTLYVGGAEVDWLPLYPNPVHRVPLPLYPFQRHHCWVEPPVTSETAFLKEFDHLFYQLTWQAYPLVESPVKTLPSVLVLCHNGDLLNGLSQALTAKHATVSTVLLSTGKREISGNRYICGYSAQDIEWLFIQLENKSIDTLVYITPSGEQAQDDYAGIQENLDKGLFAVMNLIKGITKAHYHHEMELILISYNGYCVTKSESVLSPHNAATLSIGRVIEQEYPHFSARAIDTDLTTGTNQLAEEILNSDHRQYLISYRGGIRYAQCFGRAEVEPVRTMIRRDGNYLITGGTGDIGLETARYLAQTGCRSVTLLSRSGFPDRSRWDDSDLSPGDRGKVEILRQIEQYGVLLIIESVDICQYDVLTERLEQARQKTGPFHGVFHSAGLAGAGFILRKEDADTWKVLDPKIKGTWFLDQATRLDPLDFMVLYSSAVTQSGEAGQSDYVAANTYLDAYCDYRNALGKRTFAINWVSWKETGMSVRFGINVDTITRALPTSLALEGLDLLLKSDYKRVMIGQYTVSSNILIMDEYSRNLVTEDMRQKIQRYKDSLNRDLSGSSIIREGDREVAQIYKGRVRILPHSEKDKVDENTFSGLNINLQTRSPEEVEDNITKVYSAVLGYKDIDIYDNFFEMGGDSIILTRMQGFIDQMYPDAITAADLFEYTSVFTLSQYIYETLGRKKQTDARNTALAAPLAAYAEAPNILPLSAAQQRVYISHRMSKNKLTYNNPFICRVESGLSREAHLEIARRLMHRHEALRTGFSLKGKSVQQEIYDGLEPMIEYVSYAAAADIDFNTLLTKFDLAKPPLFKITVIELDNGGTIMFFDIHHIIADGYSSRMLHRDIGMIHRKEQMPEQRYQYRHYVMWERGFNQNEAYGNMKRYWEEKLRNYCPPIRYVPEKGGCPGE
ncbi:MAG: KR domain-containing protein, partial [Clostridiales bacterium]|nr:KR domain-containing protein [Clostridiales bacterium]